MKNQQKETLRQRIRMAAEQLDLPDGMLRGMPQIVLDGDLQLLVERHMGIAEYGTERIRIAAQKVTIEVLGADMHLVAMDRDSIRIRGTICGVQYLYKE
jgi:sporulation protein YqfC